AIVLQFVRPVWSGWRLHGDDRTTRMNESGWAHSGACHESYALPCRACRCGAVAASAKFRRKCFSGGSVGKTLAKIIALIVAAARDVVHLNSAAEFVHGSRRLRKLRFDDKRKFPSDDFGAGSAFIGHARSKKCHRNCHRTIQNRPGLVVNGKDRARRAVPAAASGSRWRQYWE